MALFNLWGSLDAVSILFLPAEFAVGTRVCLCTPPAVRECVNLSASVCACVCLSVCVCMLGLPALKH